MYSRLSGRRWPDRIERRRPGVRSVFPSVAAGARRRARRPDRSARQSAPPAGCRSTDSCSTAAPPWARPGSATTAAVPAACVPGAGYDPVWFRTDSARPPAGIPGRLSLACVDRGSPQCARSADSAATGSVHRGCRGSRSAGVSPKRPLTRRRRAGRSGPGCRRTDRATTSSGSAYAPRSAHARGAAAGCRAAASGAREAWCGGGHGLLYAKIIRIRNKESAHYQGPAS